MGASAAGWRPVLRAVFRPTAMLPECDSFSGDSVAYPPKSGPIFKMWRWDDAFMAVAANQTAFNRVAATAAAHAAKPCVKQL